MLSGTNLKLNFTDKPRSVSACEPGRVFSMEVINSELLLETRHGEFLHCLNKQSKLQLKNRIGVNSTGQAEFRPPLPGLSDGFTTPLCIIYLICNNLL